MASYVKDPGEKKDYGVDWSQLLAGDTISTSAWVVESGLTKEVSPAEGKTGTTTTVWLSGGTADQDYTVTNTVTTAAGRILERSFEIMVRNL